MDVTVNVGGGVAVGLSVGVRLGVGVLIRVGGAGVSIGVAMAVEVSGGSVGVGPESEKDEEKRRTTGITIQATPIIIKAIRGYFPMGGILIAWISRSPSKRPIKKNTAPIMSNRPSFVSMDVLS